MTRLIDADSIPWDVEGVGEIPVITKEEIDQMPAVEAIPIDWLEKCKDMPVKVAIYLWEAQTGESTTVEELFADIDQLPTVDIPISVGESADEWLLNHYEVGNDVQNGVVDELIRLYRSERGKEE